MQSQAVGQNVKSDPCSFRLSAVVTALSGLAYAYLLCVASASEKSLVLI